MKHDFAQIVNVKRLKKLLESFYNIVELPIAIFDTEGSALVSVGWQDLCAKLHRLDTEASKRCNASDILINKELYNKEYAIYKCENGLMYMAAPIVIRGNHVANLVVSQFLYKQPDMEYFKNQAIHFNFDINAYISALKGIPICPKEKAIKVLKHCVEFAKFISEMGLKCQEEIETKNKLKESESKHRILVENTKDGIAIIQNNLIKYINPGMAEMLGYKAHQMMETYLLEYILPKNRIKSTKTSEYYFIKNSVNSYETTFKHKAGNNVYVVITNKKITFQGKPANMIVVHDITNHKAAEEKLRYLSFHDSMTGLYNRAFFIEELKRLNTRRQLPLSIIMGDVNGLKLINDTFGHHEGDNLLKRIANILKKSCRVEDVVSRWGGDEFVIPLPKTREEEAVKICSRIKKLCDDSKSEDKGKSIPLSISLGAVTKRTIKEDIQQLIKKAEDRMYRHKLLESRSARKSILSTLMQTLTEKTSETEEHTFRVQNYAVQLGEAINLSTNELDELVLLSLLHDMGKIGIPENILVKPGKLTAKEFEIIKKHCEIGYRIAQSDPELAYIADEILAHHEKWDGTGYPRGLKGKEIPLLSRIVAIADSFDVMTHDRPYKTTMTRKQAIKELIRCSGTQFDPELVKIFIEKFLLINNDNDE